MNREEIKLLIELSTSFKEADDILSEYTDFKTDSEKIAYLRGMFDCKIIGRTGEDLHTDYVALLTTIVTQKWRN